MPQLRKPLILAMLSADIASRRRMLEGVSRFVHQSADWDLLCITQNVPAEGMKRMLSLADGVLAAAVTSNHAVLRSLRCPLVLLGEELGDHCCVLADDRAVGRTALEHFATLGLRQAAYCGIVNVPFSDLRSLGMQKAAEQAGISFSRYPRSVYLQMDNDPHEVGPFHRWLRELPKPVGLLATTSEVAHSILHHCRSLGIQVPDEIALLGVDEDEVLCELTRPHLSTVDQSGDEIGYRAAALLADLLAGRKPLHRRIEVQPRRVVVRESTDLVCSDSPAIGRALRFIRDHACEELPVQRILRNVPMSRRALERGFRRNIGRTIHQEILRLRLERAKELLTQTDLKTNHIAERCGFNSSSMLCNVFRRELDLSPNQYRRRTRVAS